MSRTKSYKEYHERRCRRRKRNLFIRRLIFVMVCLALLAAVIWLLIWIGKALASALTRDPKPTGTPVDPAVFDTPTPTPTLVPVEGLVQIGPKDNHSLKVTFRILYEKNIDVVNVRRQPDAGSTLLAKIPKDTSFQISCYYKDPTHTGFYGFNASEIGVAGGIVWVSGQYCHFDNIIDPWAVHTMEFKYSKKYGKSRVTLDASMDSSKGPNVRSEPWESDGSSYGRAANGTVITAELVYVSEDQQWWGFPAAAFAGTVLYDSIQRDPDGIVWVYQAYAKINPK